MDCSRSLDAAAAEEIASLDATTLRLRHDQASGLYDWSPAWQPQHQLTHCNMQILLPVRAHIYEHLQHFMMWTMRLILWHLHHVPTKRCQVLPAIPVNFSPRHCSEFP